MNNYAHSQRGSVPLKVRAGAALELRRREQAALYRAEWNLCASSCKSFILRYVLIDEPQGTESTIIPFRLWPAQEAVLEDIEQEQLSIILKARQLGILWLVCAYALWLALFQDGRVILLFSKGQLEADELARRITVIYDRLPAWMKEQGPSVISRNVSELAFSNGSRLQSLPATENAGRSFTASLVILDEFAFIRWAQKLYTALKPTVDGGGKLVVLSTANGRNNFFYELWEKATEGLNRFRAIFLNWQARPDRTEDWFKQVREEAISQALVDQEYPTYPEDAFSVTDAERFLDNIIWWDGARELLPPYMGEPMVLAADAGVSNDTFALVGVTYHPIDKKLPYDPERPTRLAVRLAMKWEPNGGKIDFDKVELAIRAIIEQYNVVLFCYDPYQLHQMGTSLQSVVWSDSFNQGIHRLEADKQLLDLIMARRIAHEGDSDLRSHLDNANRKPDPETRKLRIVKRTESRKIDMAVALSMACYRLLKLAV